jgi:hypothetical protein
MNLVTGSGFRRDRDGSEEATRFLGRCTRAIENRSSYGFQTGSAGSEMVGAEQQIGLTGPRACRWQDDPDHGLGGAAAAAFQRPDRITERGCQRGVERSRAPGVAQISRGRSPGGRGHEFGR